MPKYPGPISIQKPFTRWMRIQCAVHRYLGANTHSGCINCAGYGFGTHPPRPRSWTEHRTNTAAEYSSSAIKLPGKYFCLVFSSMSRQSEDGIEEQFHFNFNRKNAIKTILRGLHREDITTNAKMGSYRLEENRKRKKTGKMANSTLLLWRNKVTCQSTSTVHTDAVKTNHHSGRLNNKGSFIYIFSRSGRMG